MDTNAMKQRAVAILNARRPAQETPSMPGGGATAPSPAAPPVAAPVAQRFAHVIDRRKATGKK